MILAFVLLFVALGPLLFDKFPYRGKAMLFSLAYPFIAAWLLLGGFGLTPVGTDQFGGTLLNIIVGVTGIAFSLPIGILLALGRASDMPAVRIVCVSFIEFIRGVPLITLLVRGIDHAELFPAARHELRSVAAGADHGDAVLVRLHGRGDPRRPAGDSARTI